MRRVASNMLQKNFKSTFMSTSKDMESIWNVLFVKSRPYSDRLKKLLIINTPDCLDESQEQYQIEVNKYSIKDMFDKSYIRNVPRLALPDFDEIKSYILLEMDDFTPSRNPEYRDCVISFTIISNFDCWQMEDYKLRPWLIAGYIDGLLNNTSLAGIGRIQFLGATQIAFDEYLGGVLLRYIATHSDADDAEKIHPELPSPDELSFVNNNIELG